MTTLHEVATRLFGDETRRASITAADLGTAETAATGPDHDPMPLSPRLQAALAARRRQQPAVSDRAAGAGRVVRIRHDGYGPLDEDTPIHVLLDAPDASGRWSGWVVTPDPEYAGPQDLVLQAERSDALDPAVRMVQCWNTVQVTPEMIGTPLQDLGDAVLAQARQLAAAPLPETAPQPGVLARRPTLLPGVVTGTPLAADDPRADYHHLYRTAAHYVTAAAFARQGIAARAERLIADVARQIKAFGQTLAPGWPLAPQMHDPLPESIGYRLGEAFSLRVAALPGGEALFSLDCHRPATATIARDQTVLHHGPIDAPISCALQPGHHYRIDFGTPETADGASLKLSC